MDKNKYDALLNRMEELCEEDADWCKYYNFFKSQLTEEQMEAVQDRIVQIRLDRQELQSQINMI